MMAQPELPFDAVKLARTDDAETSKQAARDCRDLRNDHHAAILGVLALVEDANADEIANRCGLDRVQVGKRMHELERHGRVELSGATRPSNSGRMARCYRRVQP